MTDISFPFFSLFQLIFLHYSSLAGWAIFAAAREKKMTVNVDVISKWEPCQDFYYAEGQKKKKRASPFQ